MRVKAKIENKNKKEGMKRKDEHLALPVLQNSKNRKGLQALLIKVLTKISVLGMFKR